MSVDVLRVLSYTHARQEEEPCLYRKLNAAMRATGLSAEKRLAVYLDYIHHLTSAALSAHCPSSSVMSEGSLSASPKKQ